MATFSYLALGDSYTIGEQVPLADSFPYQTVQVLRKLLKSNDELKNRLAEKYPGISFNLYAPEIIAKTGWTSDELLSAINDTDLLPQYDFVSLLIGVNNQYRGRDFGEFEQEFDLLLKKAIQFTGGDPKNVYVLSIPDWGATPFAKERDREKIAAEIDQYNNACDSITSRLKSNFINITKGQRQVGSIPAFLAPDGLHPSGEEYRKWAGLLSEAIAGNLLN